MHVYIHKYIHVCIYVCICIYVYIYINICQMVFTEGLCTLDLCMPVYIMRACHLVLCWGRVQKAYTHTCHQWNKYISVYIYMCTPSAHPSALFETTQMGVLFENPCALWALWKKKNCIVIRCIHTRKPIFLFKMRNTCH